MTSPLHSIRWRLQLWHALILLLVIGALCSAVHHFQWESDLRRMDRELSTKEREVVFGLGSVNASAPRPTSPQEMLLRLSQGGMKLPAAVEAAYQGREPGFAYFSFRDRDGRVLLQSGNVPEDALLLPVPAAGVVEEARTAGGRRELSRSADFGLRVVFGRDITPELEQHRRFAWSLVIAGLGVWFVGLFGGWWLAGRAIRPIRSISRTAARIAEGNLDERITVEKGAGELQELSGVLNRTFDRLHQALERQRQFTADAAHELRTPVTILATETQRILKRERTAEEYRAALEVCAEGTTRMRRLVEDLLLLARQESAGGHRVSCDLAEIVRQTVQSLAPLAAEKKIEIRMDLQAAVCAGYEADLATVVANLAGNAILHHDREGGQVHVSTRQEGDGAFLTVRDDGPGIAVEDLPHIFERFYRADKARTMTGSRHTGLGLSMVKTIVEAHGGTVECHSTQGRGALFTIAIPKQTGTE